MQRKKLRVGFAWQTLTSENLGVGALAQSQLTIAREATKQLDVDLEAVEFCPSGGNLALSKEMGCEIADDLSPKKILLGKSKYISQLRACDLILDIGLGDSFSDIYGPHRYYFLCASKLLAIWFKKPLVISPQTIGPFKAKWAHNIARYVMKRAEKVYARDGMSKQILTDMGLIENTAETIDVAFCLPFERVVHEPTNLVHVGLNVSGLMMSGGYTRNNQFGLTVEYSDLIYRLVEYFIAQPGVQLHLVGHVLSDHMSVEDDYAANLELHAKYPTTIVAPKFKSPSEAKSYISGLDFLSGARMHACIAAFSSGIAVVPMAYSRKFNGLFGGLGYMNFADLKVDNTDQAYDKIVNGFQNRANLKIQVAEGNAIAQEKLRGYREFVKELFEKVLKAKYA